MRKATAPFFPCKKTAAAAKGRLAQEGAGGQPKSEDRDVDAVKKRLCTTFFKAVKKAGHAGKNKRE